MSDRGWRQSDLASAAGLSKAAVSNVLNGKSTPNLDTLTLLASALGITGSQLSDLYQLRERADARVRRLDGYLAAAQRAAQDHPYPGVLPGTVPPLAAVYLSQQATQRSVNRPQDTKVSPLGQGSASPSAVDVLAAERRCLVLAGPGGGKSSLLRSHLATQVEQWIAGCGKGTVPVLVQAAALADRPLAEALAAAVNSDLAQHGLIEECPAAFFAAPAQPGIGWQILIDGLDEVTDAHGRQRIMRTLATVTEGAHADLYRFVLTTRPLPEGELAALGEVAHYDLQPFTSEDLTSVACAWFHTLGLPNPQLTAEQFTSALGQARLAELARIPLMASMLCQLRAARPGQPLPASRGQIYHDFIDLLHKRQHSPGLKESPADRAGLGRYGPAALTQAEHALDHLHDLIAYLAAERRNGDSRPAIAIVESFSEARRPSRVPQDTWRAFLHDSLRGSGLLTQRADDLIFLHQTLLEYLAARHATRHPEATTRALRQVFHQPVSRGLLRKYWRAPTQDEDSFIGFLLDIAQQSQPEVCALYLSRLASPRAGLQGGDFISRQASLGTLLSADVCSRAADLLHALATDPTMLSGERGQAAACLADMGDPRGIDLLYAVVNDPTMGRWRVSAARQLADLGDPRTAKAWHALATDSTVLDDSRIDAAGQLVDMGDPRGSDLHAALAVDPTVWDGARVQVAACLADMGDPRGIDLLYALVNDPTMGGWRVWTARQLAEMGDPRGCDLLYAVATDPAVGDGRRIQVAGQLADMGDPRGTDVLCALATDLNLPDDAGLSVRQLAGTGASPSPARHHGGRKSGRSDR